MNRSAEECHLQAVLRGDSELMPEDLLNLIPHAEQTGVDYLIPLLEAMACGDLISISVAPKVQAPLAKVDAWQRPALLTLDDVFHGDVGPAEWIGLRKLLAWPRWIIIQTVPPVAGMYRLVIGGAIELRKVLLIDCSPARVLAWDRAIVRHAPQAHVTRAMRPAGRVDLPPGAREVRH